VTFDAVKAAELANVLEQADKIAARAPWTPCGASDGRCVCGLIWDGTQNNTVVRTYDAEGDTGGRPEDAHAIASLRNHALAAAEQLRAAVAERDELGAALDSALRTTDYGKDKLITVMQRRYGRTAQQWQANHDQRKAERDAALARVRELEAWFARYSIHGSPMLAVIAERDAIRVTAAKSAKENDALSKVYGAAACLRTFPVPFDDHLKLVDAVDTCRQALHDIDEDRQALECPHCRSGEPSVWDDVLFHYAHPDGTKLKMCHSPWRERCRRCSADVITGPLCDACKGAP